MRHTATHRRMPTRHAHRTAHAAHAVHAGRPVIPAPKAPAPAANPPPQPRRPSGRRVTGDAAPARPMPIGRANCDITRVTQPQSVPTHTINSSTRRTTPPVRPRVRAFPCPLCPLPFGVQSPQLTGFDSATDRVPPYAPLQGDDPPPDRMRPLATDDLTARPSGPRLLPAVADPPSTRQSEVSVFRSTAQLITRSDPPETVDAREGKTCCEFRQRLPRCPRGELPN